MIKIGKPGRKEIVSLVSDYQKRLRTFTKFEALDFKDVLPQNSSRANGSKNTKNLKKDPAAIIRELKKTSSDFVVILDERGTHFSSPELADFIKRKTDNREIKSLAFVVGGPYGLGDKAREEADLVWSLSKGVFPSEIAWLLLWEQIYRAYNINQGTPYHHV